MARLYTVTFEQASDSAPMDLVTLLMPASASNFKQVDVLRWWIGGTDTTIPGAQMVATRCRWLPATVSVGSGGSTPSPAQWDQGDAGPKCTAHTGDTSKSTTNGTAVTVDEYGFHLFNGYDSAVEGRPPFPCPNNNTAQQAFVFELLSTVLAALHFSGGIDFLEAA